MVTFRKHTVLPLDDCLYALQASLPHLTRSSLHRYLQRHGISRWPHVEKDKRPNQTFKSCPIGYFHIDIAEVRTGQGKLRLFVAIDRTSRYADVERHEKAGKDIAARFLRNLNETVPYRIHTVLTDNGVQFTQQARRQSVVDHLFDRVCDGHGIEHRLTQANHPWTNGQVKCMNRTLKEATVKACHYDAHQQLKNHLKNFINAYNFAKRLKTLKGLTPYEFICKQWTNEPQRFRINPNYLTVGLNS